MTPGTPMGVSPTYEFRHFYRGRHVQTAWSSSVAVVEILLSVRISHWTFLGVKAETTDVRWDWPEEESLLWVLDDNGDLKVCQGLQSQPRIAATERDLGIEFIVGSYLSCSGKTYLAVKWRGYQCPTWEEEDDLLDSFDEPDLFHRYSRTRGAYKPDHAGSQMAWGHLGVTHYP